MIKDKEGKEKGKQGCREDRKEGRRREIKRDRNARDNSLLEMPLKLCYSMINCPDSLPFQLLLRSSCLSLWRGRRVEEEEEESCAISNSG